MATKKLSKAERQAQTKQVIEQAKKEQAEYAASGGKEPTIDDLLGPDDPEVSRTRTTTSKKIVDKKTPVKIAAPKLLKGQMVAFYTKTGEKVIGTGVLYYVARMNGKLHYKEASQVTILPENWKEGDPLPGEDMPTDQEFDDLVG